MGFVPIEVWRAVVFLGGGVDKAHVMLLIIVYHETFNIQEVKTLY
jgi:hypothetical protein